MQKDYKGTNLEIINKWFSDLKKEYINEIPSHINLLEKTKIIKQNILLSLDTAHRLSAISKDQEIFDTSLSMKSIEEEIKKIKKDVVSMAVFGQMSSGKSSFLNSLVGENLLAVAEERTTATITIVRHIDNFEGQKDGNIEIHYKTINEILFDLTKAIEEVNTHFDNQVFDIDKFPDNIDDILLKKEDLLKKLTTISHQDVNRKNRKIVKAHLDAIELILHGLENNRENLGKIIRKRKENHNSTLPNKKDTDTVTLTDDNFFNQLKNKIVSLFITKNENENQDKEVKKSDLEHNKYLTDKDLSVFINHVIFYKDIELLKNIEFIDTPGLGSNSQLDTRKSEDFIAKADIVMILTDAKEPMQKDSELDILNILIDIQKKEENSNFFDKVFIIINKIDDTNKNRDEIKKLLDESLEDEGIEIPSKNILFVSSLFEYSKRFKKNDINNLLLKNKNNIGDEDLLTIEKTIYNFSAIEATSKFIDENIKKINKIFNDADRNFNNNLTKLDENIEKIEEKIKKFSESKDKIKQELTDKLSDIVKDEYREWEAISRSLIDDKLVEIANTEYFTTEAKKAGSFKKANGDNTSSNHYKKIAKKEITIIMEKTNIFIEKDIKNKVFNKNKIDSFKKKLHTKTKKIQTKYENDYNVTLALDDISIQPLEIKLSQNIDFEISVLKSIKQFLNLGIWGSEKKYIEVVAEKWEEYSKKKYKNNLQEKIKEDINNAQSTVQDTVKKSILDIVNTIENQLKQKLTDVKRCEKNKKETIKRKETVQNYFNILKTSYIAKAKEQNINLFK